MPARPLRIGILCYPTFGGSGVLATELGMALGRRGHQVHFLGTRRPERLTDDAAGVHVHPVEALDYPVFPHTPYALALASELVRVHREHRLDVVHAHYAVPHATSAWMAREVLGAGPLASPRVITTLHGTDITLVGSDDSYLPITRHSIQQSHHLTTPSAWLRDETWRRFDLDPVHTPIDIVPNFVDTETLRPPGPGYDRRTALRPWFPDLGDAEPVVVHVSNLRPVKRVDRVVAAMAQVPRGRLWVVGDGPDRAAAERAVAAAGLGQRVAFAGAVRDLAAVLPACSVFVLPSETESFGLAAAEAMACGVPVVASDIGGLPEVIRDGETGFLTPEGDVSALATRLRQLVDDPSLRHAMGAAARSDVELRFRAAPVVQRYERLYQTAHHRS